MKSQKKTNQEICDLVRSDASVIAAVQKVEDNEDKTLKAWVEIVKKRIDGASVKDTLREMVPLERELFTLKAFVFKSMKEVFEENKASYGLPEEADFFDVVIHPFHDKELTKIIGNLIKIYEKIGSHKLQFKKLAKKMKDVGLEWVEINGAVLVTSDKPQDVILLEEEETLKMALTTQFAEIERIKIGIELSSSILRDIPKWFLDLLKTFPTTKITKDLVSYFESLEKHSTNVS